MRRLQEKRASGTGLSLAVESLRMSILTFFLEMHCNQFDTLCGVNCHGIEYTGVGVGVGIHGAVSLVRLTVIRSDECDCNMLDIIFSTVAMDWGSGVGGWRWGGVRRNGESSRLGISL